MGPESGSTFGRLMRLGYDRGDNVFYRNLRYKLGSMSRSSYSYGTKPKTSTKPSFSEMVMKDLEYKDKRRTPEEEAKIKAQIDMEFRNACPYNSHLQLEPWKYKSKKILLAIMFAVYFTVIGFGFAIIIIKL